MRQPRVKDHTEKLKKSLLLFYQTDRWENIKKERGKKISKALTRYYSEEETKILETYLKEGYIRDRKTLAYHINKDLSYKALLNTLNIRPDLKELYDKSLSYVPLKFQKLNIDEWKKLKTILESQNISEFCENFKINDKTHKRIRTFFQLTPKRKIRKKESHPEKLFRLLLNELGIVYEQEFKIPDNFRKNKYLLDFKIGNIAIEIQGDYWHGNPKIFKEEDLNIHQIKHKSRDLNKKQAILSTNLCLIEIWENDLYFKQSKIKQLLNIIKNGRFNKKFYSSLFWN